MPEYAVILPQGYSGPLQKAGALCGDRCDSTLMYLTKLLTQKERWQSQTTKPTEPSKRIAEVYRTSKKTQGSFLALELRLVLQF